jgi:hypothetical protein
LKSDLPVAVLNQFYKLGGTDQQLHFFLEWRRRGFKKGAATGAYLSAGYSPASSKNAYKLTTTEYPAIQFLYLAFGSKDYLAQLAEGFGTFLKTLTRVMNSKNDIAAASGARVFIGFYLKYRDEILNMLDRMEKALDKALQPNEIPTEELVKWMEEGAAALKARGVDVKIEYTTPLLNAERNTPSTR